MKDKILVSIVIPTYQNSLNLVDIPLESISRQTCSKDLYEIIISNNHWSQSNRLKNKVSKYSPKFIDVYGTPPQVCNQINAGVKIAKGKYILILDHDVELSPRLIENFSKLEKKSPEIDSWYMPYKAIARGKFLNRVRNFEEKFYQNSIVAVPRITKKSTFFKIDKQYDPVLNGGPADWDFANQLREISAKFKYIDEYAYHHEEGLSFWKFITKKTIYAEGGEIYKKKWAKKNKKIYNEIVKKQYSPLYRSIGIFLENKKWRKINLLDYFLFLIMKILMASVYFYYVNKKI